MGGLPRRATFIRNEKANGPETLILDTGNFISNRPLSGQAVDAAKQKARLILKAIDSMGYAVIALGEMDLYMGRDRLLELQEQTRVAFLSANYENSAGKDIFKPYRILNTAGLKVGVIGITAPPKNRSLFQERNPGLTVEAPLPAAEKAVAAIRDKCDLVVVLSNLGNERDVELAEQVSGTDILVSGGTRRFMKRPLIKKQTLVTSGYFEGRAVGRLVVHLDGVVKGWISRQELDFLDKQIRIAAEKTGTPEGQRRHDDLLAQRTSLAARTLYEPELVILDPSFEDDPEISAMITEYRKELESTSAGGAARITAQVNLVHYKGALECAKCHESRYRFWITTDHSRAFDTLVTRDSTADPDCVPCHVTGNERPTGYQIKAPKDFLQGVQCESCHGIGSLHTSDPRRYSLIHLPLAHQCMECHTEEQDGEFDYVQEKGHVCSELK